MRIRRLSSIGLLAALPLFLASPVRGDSNGDVSVSFFTGGDADAHWDKFNPPPPSDTDEWSIELRVGIPPSTCPPPNYVNCTYAGFNINGVAGAPPPATNEPSFYLNSSINGPGTSVAGGGSPRLVMQFSDKGDLQLRPLFWTPGWQKVGGSGLPQWDGHSTTCPYLYGGTYTVGLACHPGATVTSVYLVTDSSWLYTSGYVNWIDQVQYGNVLITSPEGAGCHEGDGNGDFQGDHGNGNVQFDGDGCKDGDSDQVSSSNRGDGKKFASTSINSISVNSLGNTMTMAGAGTVDGVPVTFLLVAVESTAVTPGSVTMTFSDGFTNSGNLTSGSVLLH